jgi:hypothetical protein
VRHNRGCGTKEDGGQGHYSPKGRCSGGVMAMRDGSGELGAVRFALRGCSTVEESRGNSAVAC